MKNEQRRRSSRFPIADIHFVSAEVPAELVEISRTGMRLTTPLAIEVGQSVSGKLTYRGDAVEVTGAVRWRREAGADSDDRSQLPFWEIGVAFTRVGKTDPEGIWRRLEVHERGAPPS